MGGAPRGSASPTREGCSWQWESNQPRCRSGVWGLHVAGVWLVCTHMSLLGTSVWLVCTCVGLLCMGVC